MALMGAGAQVKIVAPRLGSLKGAQGETVAIDFSLLTCDSVLFDAVYIPGGETNIEALKREAEALQFVSDAYKHCKAIAASGAGVELLRALPLGTDYKADSTEKKQVVADEGVIISRGAQTDEAAEAFIKAIAQHRHWSRETA